MTVTIQPCAVAAIWHAATFPQLAEEYESESLIEGMPSPLPDFDSYEKLEAAGRSRRRRVFVQRRRLLATDEGRMSAKIINFPRKPQPAVASPSITDAELTLLRAAAFAAVFNDPASLDPQGTMLPAIFERLKSEENPDAVG